MHQVPSPACRNTSRAARWRGLVLAPVAGVLTLGLTLSLGSTAGAEDLKDKRDRVRKAVVAAQKDVSASKAEVSSRIAKLAKAEAALAKAKRTLAAATEAVNQAKAVDAAIGKRLAEARKKLAAAKRAVVRAKAAVDQQLSLIGEVARQAYQQQTDLVGLSVVFDSSNTGDLSQRLQWSTTVFDSTTAQADRLRDLQATLVKAEKLQAEIEQQIAEDKAKAAANVARLKVLQGKAVSAQAKVLDLVAQAAKAKRAAAADLRAEQAEYDSLQRQEAAVSKEIKRRAEIARKKALAEEAKRRAAAKKAGKPYQPSTGSSNSLGFIRPINASPGSPFGLRFHPILKIWRMHRGTDWGAACGTPLYAANSGRVASAGWNGGFGKWTVIDHGFINGKYMSTGYAHQSRIVVGVGQRVKRGQLIGYVGTTGLSTVCHLHLQVYVNGGVVNPMKYIP